MKTCGTCRHWRQIDIVIGVCERGNWGDLGLVNRSAHRKHVLHKDHADPTCHESKRKRVRRGKHDQNVEDWDGYYALDDIKQGDEVELV